MMDQHLAMRTTSPSLVYEDGNRFSPQSSRCRGENLSGHREDLPLLTSLELDARRNEDIKRTISLSSTPSSSSTNPSPFTTVPLGKRLTPPAPGRCSPRGMAGRQVAKFLFFSATSTQQILHAACKAEDTVASAVLSGAFVDTTTNRQTTQNLRGTATNIGTPVELAQGQSSTGADTTNINGGVVNLDKSPVTSEQPGPLQQGDSTRGVAEASTGNVDDGLSSHLQQTQAPGEENVVDGTSNTLTTSGPPGPSSGVATATDDGSGSSSSSSSTGAVASGDAAGDKKIGLPVSPLLHSSSATSSGANNANGNNAAKGEQLSNAFSAAGSAALNSPQMQQDGFVTKFIANIALLSSVALMLSPAQFFYQLVITRGENIKQSRKQLILLLPYLLLWVSAMLWATWAYLDSRPEIFQLQCLGAVVYGFYVVIFCCGATAAQKGQIQSVVAGTMALVSFTSLQGACVMDPKHSKFLFAYSALSFQILLYMVPFIQLADVVRTGVVAVFPLPLCFVSMMSSFLWTYYSWIKWSPAFWAASLAGFVFNGMQVSVVLYIQWKYGKSIVDSCKLEAPIANGRLPFLMQHGYQIDLRKARSMRSQFRSKMGTTIKAEDHVFYNQHLHSGDLHPLGSRVGDGSVLIDHGMTGQEITETGFGGGTGKGGGTGGKNGGAATGGSKPGERTRLLHATRL
ncbi:unnamed protein product [Amoebophrya sp. A120]|nr:unnamed protein product [Amoebophrya sp. A120]|eukprot:GSA120T00004003001.1